MNRQPTALGSAETTLRRHRQEPRDFAVEADGQWPTLHDAFEAISHDGGSSAGHAVYFVPEAWTEHLDQIEAALHGLTEADREEFCLGEFSDVAAIAARSADLVKANRLLNAFFEDWPDEIEREGGPTQLAREVEQSAVQAIAAASIGGGE